MSSLPNSIVQLPAFFNDPQLAIYADTPLPSPPPAAFLAAFENFHRSRAQDVTISLPDRADLVQSQAIAFSHITPAPQAIANDQLLAALSRIEGKLETVQGDVDGIKTDVKTIKTDLGSLQEEVRALHLYRGQDRVIATNASLYKTRTSLLPVPAAKKDLPLRPTNAPQGQRLSDEVAIQSLVRLDLNRWLDFYTLPQTQSVKQDRQALLDFVTGGASAAV